MRAYSQYRIDFILCQVLAISNAGWAYLILFHLLYRATWNLLSRVYRDETMSFIGAAWARLAAPLLYCTFAGRGYDGGDGEWRMADDSLKLIPAAAVSSARLSSLLNEAYADYFLPVWLDEPRVVRMCQEVDVTLAHSVLAVAGDELVGVALLSQRGDRGWIKIGRAHV